MGLMKELNDLNGIYKGMYDVDEAMVVTNADKKGNTPAYQGYKSGKKGKDGKPLYKAADHLKDDVEVEISSEVEKLIESGLFSVEEIAKISGIEIDEAQTAYEKARKAAARRAADRNAARKRGEMGGRMERETYTNEAGKEMHYKGYSA